MTKVKTIVGLVLGLSSFLAFAQSAPVPDTVYYRFNAPGTTVANEASTPVGNNPASIGNHTIGGAGLTGSALQGSASASGFDTGWPLNLPSTGWTVAFWVGGNQDPSGANYYYGDTTSGFRAFTGGVAGSSVIFRGQFNDVLLTGALATLPAMIHLVYDPSVPELRSYVNGVQNTTVQGAVPTITGGNLFVGSYNSTSMPAGGLLDEFRLYRRALPAAEIASTWNITLVAAPASTAAIPTLNEWGLALLATLVGFAAFAMRRNRSAR